MIRQSGNGLWAIMGVALWLGVSASAAIAEDAAPARFKGTGKDDPIRIAHVTCKPADTKGVGAITFDLAWDHSWRAAWEVPEAQHGGKGTLKLENWDAAWVFVKFRKPGADWKHATLSTNAADQKVPAGATLDVGLSDDPAGSGTGGKRGLGAFVYRSAPGSGVIDWKGITLRWLYSADGVASVDKVLIAVDRATAAAGGLDPDKAPEAADDTLDKVIEDVEQAEIAAGKADKVEIRVCAVPMVYVPECAFWLGDGTGKEIAGHFTAGDTAAPFRMESEAALTLGGADAKQLGNNDGIFTLEDFNSVLTQPLPSSFPKGFAAFYCMKRELTQRDWVACLNSISAERGAALRKDIGDVAGIRLEGAGAAAQYVAASPGSVCSGMTWSADTAYAGWAGLRPMTELELEKAIRGFRVPVIEEVGPSYWNIAGIGVWPWDSIKSWETHGERAVTVGNARGRSFKGTHGLGTLALPADWPQADAVGSGRRYVASPNLEQTRASDRLSAAVADTARLGHCKFRCVRTAPQ